MGPSAPSKGFEVGAIVKIRTRLSWPEQAVDHAFQNYVGKIGTIIDIKVNIHLFSLEREEKAYVMWEDNSSCWVPVSDLIVVRLN